MKLITFNLRQSWRVLPCIDNGRPCQSTASTFTIVKVNRNILKREQFTYRSMNKWNLWMCEDSQHYHQRVALSESWSFRICRSPEWKATSREATYETCKQIDHSWRYHIVLGPRKTFYLKPLNSYHVMSLTLTATGGMVSLLKYMSLSLELLTSLYWACKNLTRNEYFDWTYALKIEIANTANTCKCYPQFRLSLSESQQSPLSRYMVDHQRPRFG